MVSIFIVAGSTGIGAARWIFWGSVLAVLYAYAGYPLWLLLRRKWRSMPVRFGPISPSVSVIMAVKDESRTLVAKLENLAQLDYPRELIEVIVVSDGSTDGTNDVLTSLRDRVRPILLSESEGKAAALNHGIAAARNEIVVFVDARQRIEPQALKFLVGNFADPNVGCVSGELILVEDLATGDGKAVGLYWKMEKQIRKLESDTGSVMGATGALYAVRKELLTRVPCGTLLDDVYIPFQAIRQGKRVIFEPRAVVLDKVSSDWRHEFRRKVRTLTGCYQLLQLAPWLLTKSNPHRFELFSHKLLRLLVPFALVLALVCSWFASGVFYRAAFVAQICFYGLALLPIVRPGRKLPRLVALPFTFVMLNAAAAFGLINFLSGRKNVWVSNSNTHDAATAIGAAVPQDR